MIAVLLASFAAMTGLLRELFGLLKEPKYRAGVIWLLLLQLIAVVFYRIEEGWSWLDSLYFSVITMSTVGYGDFSPTTPLSKIFTMVFIFLSISVFVSFVSMLAKERGNIQQQRAEKRKKQTKDNPASS